MPNWYKNVVKYPCDFKLPQYQHTLSEFKSEDLDFLGIFYYISLKVESLCYRGFYVSTNVSGMKRILYQYSVEIQTNISRVFMVKNA